MTKSKRKIMTCKLCKKKFAILFSRFLRGNGKFCTLKCKFKGQIGTKMKEETKKKLSESHKRGENRICKFCKKTFYVRRSALKGGGNHGLCCSKTCAQCIRPRKNSGKFTHTSGYVIKILFINGRNKYIPEHIYVAEQAIGRKLLSPEEVHHINEVKGDNRPENLYVFQSGSLHAKYHAAIRKGCISPITKSNLPYLAIVDKH